MNKIIKNIVFILLIIVIFGIFNNRYVVYAECSGDSKSICCDPELESCPGGGGGGCACEEKFCVGLKKGEYGVSIEEAVKRRKDDKTIYHWSCLKSCLVSMPSWIRNVETLVSIQNQCRELTQQIKTANLLCNTSADCAGCKPGENYPILKCDKNKQCKITYECGKSNCKQDSDCIKEGIDYHYECDAKGEFLEDRYQDSKTKTWIYTLYYPCVKIQGPGKSTCQPGDFFWNGTNAPLSEFKELIKRLERFNNVSKGKTYDSSKKNLFDYSSKCSSNNLKYTCDKYTYQCKSSFQGEYSSLKECQDKCKTFMVYTCNWDTHQCREALLGSYKTMAECESVCTTTATKLPPTKLPPTKLPPTKLPPTPSKPPITSEPSPEPEPVPEVCRVNDFDITPHLASLLALSDKRSYFIADWWTSNCNSCELWYLPVDADGQPLRDKYGIKQTEYIKSASSLPTSSPDPAYDSDYKYDKDPSNLYVIKNYPQKWGHYLYKLICEGPDNQDESFPVHIFVAPWMIWYEVPPVMPTSKFHTIITSPGWGQSIEEYKGY